MNSPKYMDSFLMENTTYKSVRDALNRDQFSVLVKGNGFWFERFTASERVWKLAIKEMKRLFPDSMHII